MNSRCLWNIPAQVYRGMFKETGAEDRELEPVGDTALGQLTHSEDVPGFRVRLMLLLRRFSRVRLCATP